MMYQGKEIGELTNDELVTAKETMQRLHDNYYARIDSVKTLPESTRKKRLSKLFETYPSVNQQFLELKNEIENQVNARGLNHD